jgi:DNA polymerase III subunit epsilon
MEKMISPFWELDWNKVPIVAFDTETSGAYPLGSEIVEIGAVKWVDGQKTDEFLSFVRPSQPMGEAVIKIHGITNKMVEDAPSAAQVFPRFREFVGDAALLAHHAPFDLGFLVSIFEDLGLEPMPGPLLCSSLLSRRLIPESPNHRLQTLIQFLKLPQGTAHRALDDARACLEVGLECFRRVTGNTKLSQIGKIQGKNLEWNQFRLASGTNLNLKVLAHAVRTHKDIEMMYQGGSVRGTRRVVTPLGIVRNPDGDYLQGLCHIDRIAKRFYISRIDDAIAVDRNV